LSFWSLCL